MHTGSFSAAARQLGCTQPAVSQQIRALEQSVGTTVLVRDGREARLTEAGSVLVRHTGAVLAGLGAAEAEVAALVGLRAGQVRLVSFPSASATLVPGALAGMRASHPGVRVSLTEAEPPRSVELLRSGEAEVVLAFRHGPPSPPEGEWTDLRVTRLFADPLVAVLPSGHAAAGPGPLSLAALADEPWIAGCPRCQGHLLRMCEAVGFRPRVDYATDDYPAVLHLVAAGLGVAVLPALALEAVPARGVEQVPLDQAAREVVALTLPDLEGVPSVRELLRQLVDARR